MASSPKIANYDIESSHPIDKNQEIMVDVNAESCWIQRLRLLWTKKIKNPFKNRRDYGDGKITRALSIVTTQTTVLQTWPITFWTFLLSLIGWTSFVAIGIAGWPSLTEGSGHHIEHRLNCEEEYLEVPGCFCEAFRSNAIVKQPVNTYSNLAYTAVALACAFLADFKQRPTNPLLWKDNVNLMTSNLYYPISFCLVATNISYSSGFLHAGWTAWGGMVDSISILIMFGWFVLTSITKLYLWISGCTWKRMVVAAQLHSIVLITITACLYGFYFGIGQNMKVQKYLLYLPIVLATFPEIARCIYEIHANTKRKGNPSSTNNAWWLGWVTLVVFAVGYVIQVYTQSGSRLCYPNSFWQGHAIWHALSAVSLLSYFFFSTNDSFPLEEEGEIENDDEEEDEGEEEEEEKDEQEATPTVEGGAV